MKKILLCFMVFIFIFSGGCSYSGNIKNINAVTAVGIFKKGAEFEYCFMIGKSSKDSKDTNEEEKGKIYSFEANNFDEAVKRFEHNLGTIDFGHLGAIISDVEYLSLRLSNDFRKIKNRVNISPLINFYVSENRTDVFKTIASSYDSSPDVFVKKCFPGKRKAFLCSLPEIYLANLNKHFNACLPVVSVDSKNMTLNCNGFVVFSKKTGTIPIAQKEFEVLSSYYEKFAKSSGGFKTEVKNHNLKIVFYNAVKQGDAIVNISKKYLNSGFDVLNVIYFSRSCFATYDAYEHFVENINLNEVEFSRE